MTNTAPAKALHPTTTLAVCPVCGHGEVTRWADPHHLSRTGVRRVPLANHC